MNLNTAQLGQTPGINLGGYIPAAAQKTSLLQQALASFLSGAAGTVASRGIDAVLPSVQQQMAEKEFELAKDRFANEKDFQNRSLTEQGRQADQLQQIRERQVAIDEALKDPRIQEVLANVGRTQAMTQTENETRPGIIAQQGATLNNTNANTQNLLSEADLRKVLAPLQFEGLQADTSLKRSQGRSLEAQTQGQINLNDASVLQKKAAELNALAAWQKANGIDPSAFNAVSARLPRDFDVTRPDALLKFEEARKQGEADLDAGPPANDLSPMDLWFARRSNPNFQPARLRKDIKPRPIPQIIPPDLNFWQDPFGS